MIGIADLRRLLAGGTPRPWCGDRLGQIYHPLYDQDGEHDGAHLVSSVDDPDDGALIVALRNAAPELLDRLEVLVSRLARARNALAAAGVDRPECEVVTGICALSRERDAARALLARCVYKLDLIARPEELLQHPRMPAEEMRRYLALRLLSDLRAAGVEVPT